MIELMRESSAGIVGLHVTGTLHESDYAESLPKLEELFREHGRLRVLFYADSDFRGWDMSAAWQDAYLGFRHAADFERLALVRAHAITEFCVRLGEFDVHA